MSNSRDDKPHDPPHEPSLDMLALAESLAESHAAGDAPQLSALIATLPDAAGDLADAAMLDALVAGAEAEADDLQVGEPPALSPGAQRAVADIFGAGDADELAMVAETQAPYAVREGAEAEVTADAAGGLLALAREQGMDAEALAARIMFSPEGLRWLDHVALPLARQPDVLVFHLVGALGTPRERVQKALAHGNAATDTAIGVGDDTFDLAEALTTSAPLTPAQRAYWSAQLAGRE